MVKASHFYFPGPGEYLDGAKNSLSQSISQKRNAHSNNSFGANQKRFDKDDTLPPGPGTYMQSELEVGVKHKPGKRSLKTKDGPKHTVIKSSVNSIGLKGENGCFKSTTKRELDHLIGKDNPGVGQFNIKDHQSIGVQKIQGGAPNNFLILSKNFDPFIHKVETSPQPRLLPPEMRSKQTILVNCYFSSIEYWSWRIHQGQSR